MLYAILTHMPTTYELMLLLRTSVSEEKRKKIFEEVKKSVSASGKIIDTKDLGKRLLAYSIKKEKEANFWLLTLEIEGKEAQKLTGILKLKEEVLRALIVRKEIKYVSTIVK